MIFLAVTELEKLNGKSSWAQLYPSTASCLGKISLSQYANMMTHLAFPLHLVPDGPSLGRYEEHLRCPARCSWISQSKGVPCASHMSLFAGFGQVHCGGTTRHGSNRAVCRSGTSRTGGALICRVKEVKLGKIDDGHGVSVQSGSNFHTCLVVNVQRVGRLLFVGSDFAFTGGGCVGALGLNGDTGRFVRPVFK
jgi:hypothetical protein